MLPLQYADVELRNVTPVCPGRHRIGVGFDVLQPGGGCIRLALNLATATVLADLLQACISSFAGSQSAGSELSPSAPVSVPSEGVNT